MGASTWSSLLLFSSQTPSDFVLLSLLLAILLVSSYYYYVKGAASKHGGRHVPPGSVGLPLGLGENLHFLVSSNFPMGSPRPFLSSRLRKYGAIFTTHLLGYPTVVSMDAEFNKLLLTNEGKLVQTVFPKFMKKILGPFSELHGKRHLQIREIFKSVFSPSAIQALHLIPIQEHACNFLRSCSQLDVVNSQQEPRKFAFIYIIKFLLALEPEDPNTLLALNDFEILMRYQLSIPVDIPGSTFSKALKARSRLYTRIFELHDAQKKVVGAQSNEFLNALMAEINKQDTTIIEKDIPDILLGFIIGAIDTTSILITNIIKVLSENPHVLDELLKEHKFIQTNKKENEFLDWEDMRQMQFTKCVIKETLRITSIAEFVPRVALQDIVFRDMVIPEGWRILVNFSMLHLSGSQYENPSKFDPWRWQDTKLNNQAFFMPFGGGMRMCLGPLFVETEVSIFLHYLITRYKWQVLKDKGGNFEAVAGLFVSKAKRGLPIKISPL